MNKYIKENLSELLSIFILLQPIINLLTGIHVDIFSLSTIISVIFLILIMYITTIIYKKKLSTYTYLSFIICLFLYMVVTMIYKDKILIEGVLKIINIFYLPVLLISLYDLKDEFKISKMTLFTTLLIYTILFATIKLLQVNFPVSEGKICGIISILTPTLFIIIKDINNKIFKVIFLITYLVSILIIGAKLPLMTLLITIISCWVYYTLTCINKKNNKIKLNFENYMTKFNILLIIILLLLPGHIIAFPSVALIITVIILDLAKRNKKELLFTAYNMGIGGIETALICLLDNINYNKYNVTVILEKKEGILLEKLNKNAKVDELKVSNHKNVVIRKLINFSRKFMFKLLYCNTYDFSCCYATYSFSGNKIALIASKNTAFYVHNNYKYVYKNKDDTIKFFKERNISSFRKIIFVANESQEDFIDFFPELKEKTLVLNNFIDVDLIKEKSKEKISEKKDKSKKLFMFIGRLDDDAKKIGRAINLVKKIKDINLWIVGDGPDRKLYEEQVKKNKLEDKVTFLGRKQNPYPYMKKADYLILTSDYEGFPVTYLEAIVLNVPIITTIPTSDDKIDLERDYANVISKDESKMVKEVQKILKNPKKQKNIDMKKIQENRIEYFENMFDEVI